jgi:hypothetical protein
MAWRRRAKERQHADFLIGKEVTMKPCKWYMYLRAIIKVEIMSKDVEYVARLGRKRGGHQTFVTFTQLSKKLGSTSNKIRSACSHFSMCLL